MESLDMRLKEEAAVAHLAAVRPINIRNRVGLNLLRGPHTAETEGANEPNGRINGTQWLSNYENSTSAIVETSANTTAKYQKLITNNNLDNAGSGCVTDDNSNHHDNNRSTISLANNQQLLRSHVSPEDPYSMSVSSPDDSLVGDCEDSHKIPSSAEASLVAEEEEVEEEEEEEEEEEDSGGESSASSSSDSLLSDGGCKQGSEDRRVRRRGTGILNPNYPGFQRYAKRLHFARAAAASPTEEEEEDEEEDEEEEEAEEEVAKEERATEGEVEPSVSVARNLNNNNNNNDDTDTAVNNNNNNNGEELNQLDGVIKRFDKSFIYDKSKLNIPVVEEDLEEEREEEGSAGRGQQETSTSDEDAGFVEEEEEEEEEEHQEQGKTVDKEKDLNVDPIEVEPRISEEEMAAAGKCAIDPKIPDQQKMADAYLSGTKDDIGGVVVVSLDPNKLFGEVLEEEQEEVAKAEGPAKPEPEQKSDAANREPPAEDKAKESQKKGSPSEEGQSEGEEKFMKEVGKKEVGGPEGRAKAEEEIHPPAPPRKKEKMEINYSVRMATAAAAAAAAAAASAMNPPPSAPLAPDVVPAAPTPVEPKNVAPRMVSQVKVKQQMAQQPAKCTPGWAQVTRREGNSSSSRNLSNRRSVPAAKDKRRTSPEIMGGFDVYNIETAMPKIDLDALENHLRAAKEEERRRRNDREEIRRRLAMGPEADDYYGPSGERQGGRKPSLQSRLQSGMNLQICFMNETVSDGESPTGSECDSPSSNSPTAHSSTLLSSSLPSCLPSSPSPRMQCHQPSSSSSLREPLMVEGGLPDPSHSSVGGETGKPVPPRSLSLKAMLMSRGSHSLMGQHPPGLIGGVVGRWDILGSGGRPEEHPIKWDGEDFFGRQARLQAEARVALAQAKEMAHMQMEVERQRQKVNSPITQMVRSSLLKVGLVFPADRRRVSRQMLTEMNVAQLQVIVNDLHTQIEVLNEDLVKLLMERDDLHMEQDSMLVDIEDLTRYLGAKEKALKESGRAGGCGRSNAGNSEGGSSRGVGGGGSLPSLPLIFRHGGGSKAAGDQGSRSRLGGSSLLVPKKK